MRYFLLILILSFPLSCFAEFSLGSLEEYIEKKTYPEEKLREIKIKKENSILDSKEIFSPEFKEFQDLIEKPLDIISNNPLKEAVSELGFNKFYLGSGIIDITFQVKNGVNYALKETFNRYPEYQRRKISEEIINSNFHSHKLSKEFIQGKKSTKIDFSWSDILRNLGNNFTGADLFDYQNLINNEPNTFMELVSKLSNSSKFQSLNAFFLLISKSLVFLFLGFQLLNKIKTSDSKISYSSLILNSIVIFIGLSLISPVLNLFILIFKDINSLIVFELSKGLNLDFDIDMILKNSWSNLANEIGYMPSLILSVLDSLSQFLSYMFYSLIVLYLVIFKIFSPVICLGFISDRFKVISILAFLDWLKILSILSILPLIYASLEMLLLELKIFGNPMLNISLSISSFLLVPIMAFMVFTRSKNLGVNEK